jgi:hypothetical protein
VAISSIVAQAVTDPQNLNAVGRFIFHHGEQTGQLLAPIGHLVHKVAPALTWMDTHSGFDVFRHGMAHTVEASTGVSKQTADNIVNASSVSIPFTFFGIGQRINQDCTLILTKSRLWWANKKPVLLGKVQDAGSNAYKQVACWLNVQA